MSGYLQVRKRIATDRTRVRVTYLIYFRGVLDCFYALYERYLVSIAVVEGLKPVNALPVVHEGVVV